MQIEKDFVNVSTALLDAAYTLSPCKPIGTAIVEKLMTIDYWLGYLQF